MPRGMLCAVLCRTVVLPKCVAHSPSPPCMCALVLHLLLSILFCPPLSLLPTPMASHYRQEDLEAVAVEAAGVLEFPVEVSNRC